MKVSKLLEIGNIKQLFLTFFNLGTKESDDYFEFKIRYRQSTKSTLELTDNLREKNNKLISEYTGMDFKLKGKDHIYTLNNDLRITRHELLNKIYKKIEQSRFQVTDSEFQDALFMGLFGFRGSLDMSLMLYSVDLLDVNISTDYINHIATLLISSKGLEQLNLNFRELQPEYKNNVSKRNTQVRINLRWFYDNYFDHLGKINIYKQQILEENEDKILRENISYTLNNNFIERLLFYNNKIVGEKTKFNMLSEKQKKIEIDKLRQELEFDTNNDNSVDIKRDRNIVRIATVLLPDECACCKNEYDLMDRTFLMKDSKYPYLEIHHVISFGSNNDSDVLENLVKLCPACHKALTPNRANKDYQESLIEQILQNSPEVDEYLNNFLSDMPSREQKIGFVFKNLK